VGVQFLGLGYCTEQNTDGIPSFVHCYVKSWGGPSNFFFLGGGEVRTPHPPSGCARGHTKVADRAGAAVLTRYVRTVVGDGLTVTAAEAGQTVTRVAALTAVTARRSVATRSVVGAEVQV